MFLEEGKGNFDVVNKSRCSIKERPLRMLGVVDIRRSGAFHRDPITGHGEARSSEFGPTGGLIEPCRRFSRRSSDAFPREAILYGVRNDAPPPAWRHEPGLG